MTGWMCVCMSDTLVTEPCGAMPGGSPGLTREQVSIRYRAEREVGREEAGKGGGYKSSWHLPYLGPPLQASGP